MRTVGMVFVPIPISLTVHFPRVCVRDTLGVFELTSEVKNAVVGHRYYIS